jgi:L-rhamnose mutarotase
MKRFISTLEDEGHQQRDLMSRICFQLQVKPELLAEYIERHTPVWPEMLAEIAASGRRNYSLYLADGGRLFGYYETDDDAAAQAYLAASEVAARWEAEMASFFVGLDGRPDQAATPLTEIFHLEDQLTAAAASARALLEKESDAS